MQRKGVMISHAFFGCFMRIFSPSAFARFYFLRVSRPDVYSSRLQSRFVRHPVVRSPSRGYYVMPRAVDRELNIARFILRKNLMICILEKNLEYILVFLDVILLITRLPQYAESNLSFSHNNSN